MTQQDHHQPAPSSAPSEGGSQSGEGRNRRRRRRGSRREDGPQQDPNAPSTPETAAEGRPDARPNPRPDIRSNEQREESQAEAGGSEADRKRKRRRKKKSSDGTRQDAQAETTTPAAETTPEEERPTAAPLPGRQNGPRQQSDRRPAQPAQGEKKERAPRGSVLQRRVSRGDYVDMPAQKEEPVVVTPVNAINVDGYVAHHKGWQREVLTTLRNIINGAGGEIQENILWSQPVFTSNGPICYLKAFTDHVNLGFWRGTELDDPENLLVGDMTKMRHVTLSSTSDIKRELFESMVRQAVRLNRDKGDPTLS